MYKNDIKTRVNGLNEYMLADTEKELVLLNISNVYTYNKAIALIDKDNQNKDWYSVNRKHCYKNWNEIEAFLDGLCLGKNTQFTERDIR